MAKNTRNRAKQSFFILLLLYRSKRVTEGVFDVICHPPRPGARLSGLPLSQQPESCLPDTGSWGGGLV